MAIPILPTEGIIVIGVLLASGLLLLEVFTIGYAIITSRRDRQKDQVRPDVRRTLLQTMGENEPNWDKWEASLTTVEQEVAADVLYGLLRNVKGQARDKLQQAGQALDLGESAVKNLQASDRATRLKALSWLYLLEKDVSTDLLWAHCTDDRDVRDSAARLVYDQRSDEADLEEAINLLFSEEDWFLSILGLDTLYRIALQSPQMVTDYMREEIHTWAPAQIEQTLRVIGSVGPVSGDVSLSWLVPLLDHELVTIRAATARALAGYGWQEDLRDQIDVQRLITDESPKVRRAAATMLAHWGDSRALDMLKNLATAEAEAQTRLHALRLLYEQGEGVESPVPEPVEETQRWVQREQEIAGS